MSNDPPVEDAVAASQESWRRARRDLNRRRGDLADLAAGRYAREVRVGDLPVLAPPAWILDEPVPLDRIRLEWAGEPAPVGVTGGEPQAGSALPLRSPGRRFPRYTAAIERLDPPALFENRTGYRLLDVDLSAEPYLRFGLGSYFEKLDLSEAVAHELADATRGCPPAAPSGAALPLRALVGDPFDLRRRVVLPAIETLTLRRDRSTGTATFLLHWRDPAKVATTGGVHSLVPGGEFQPSTDAAHDRENDFDLWRSIVREYSEEVLGQPERDGSSGEPLAYDAWPLYRELERARRNGRVRPYCLGIGVDPLTLSVTILTVTVIDDDVFDDLFGDAVEVNAEGTLVRADGATRVSDGLPFDDEYVSHLLDEGRMASSGACILHRARALRAVLLPDSS
jgi:hypothetical protein